MQGVPARARALRIHAHDENAYWHGREFGTFEAQRTAGGGACAIHAVKGDSLRGLVAHRDPRGWIRRTLESVGAYEDVRSRCIAHGFYETWNNVITCVESDLMLPYLRGEADAEAQVFGSTLVANNLDLWEECLSLSMVNELQLKRREAAKKDVPLLSLKVCARVNRIG